MAPSAKGFEGPGWKQNWKRGVGRSYALARPIRRYAEQSNNIVRWSEFDRGGHFAALEAPDLLMATCASSSDHTANSEAIVSTDALIPPAPDDG